MGVDRFENLVAWQRSVELCGEVFKLSEPRRNDDKFWGQIRDAAESAPSLIAEGFLRFTTAEFIRYLRMARAELGEVQSDLAVGIVDGRFTAAEAAAAVTIARRAMGTTTNLLKAKLRQQAEERRAKNAAKRKPPRRRRRK